MAYVKSESFTSLQAETRQLHTEVSTIKYSVLIKNGGFKVRKYNSESDYSLEVEETFAKFKQGAAKNYQITFSEVGRNEPRRGEGAGLRSPALSRDLFKSGCLLSEKSQLPG